MLLRVTRRFFVTLWFWLGIAVGTLVATIFVALFALLSLFSGRNLVTHDLITMAIEDGMAAIIFMWMSGPGIWKLNEYRISGITDEDTDPSKGPFILAANHNSFVDTLFIAMLPYRKTYTYNYKYRFAPLFGQLCVLAGYVGIRPGQSATLAIEHRVREGYSIMIYPEGTRNKDPSAGVVAKTLRTGTFRVASSTGATILPIKLVGTEKIVMPYWIADSGTIDIITCTPYTVAKEFDVEEEKTRFANIINSCPTK